MNEKRGFVASALFVLGIALVGVAPVSAGWTRAARLDEPGTWQQLQSVATSGEAVHLVWSAGTYDEAKTNGIFYRRSEDCGQSWASPMLLAELPLVWDGLEVAAWGDEVHLVWSEWKTSRIGVYYRVSRDGGASWGEPLRLSDPTKHASQPVIAAVAETVVVAYERAGRLGSRIVLEASTDGGRSWKGGDVTRREGHTGYATHDVALAADAQGRIKRVHLTTSTADNSKTPSEVWLQSSANLGQSWFRPLRLDEGQQPGFRRTVDLQMGASDAGVQVVWSRLPRLEILHKGNVRGEFVRENLLTDPSTRRDRYQQGSGPRLAFSGSGKVLRTGWIEYYEGKRNGAVMVARSGDRGRSWGRSKRLAKGTRLGVALARSTGGLCRGATHLVYQRASTGGDDDLTRLFYRRRPAKLP